MKTNLWDVMCSALETTGKVAVAFVVCATVCILFKMPSDYSETEDEE